MFLLGGIVDAVSAGIIGGRNPTTERGGDGFALLTPVGDGGGRNAPPLGDGGGRNTAPPGDEGGRNVDPPPGDGGGG